MGLAEVLVAGAVGGVIIAGSMKSLQLSLQSAQVVKSSLSESDLHHTIRQVLSSKQDCLSNFKPTGETIPSDPKQASSIGLYGADREWGVGEVVRFAKTFGNTDNTDDEALLKKGVAFKGDLSIVKMELKGQPPRPKDSTTKLDKKPALRTFVVYYKKEGMGGYSTLGGEPCDKDKLQGCYFNQCKVELRLDDSDTTGTNEAKCEGMCADYRSGGGGGSGNPDCYKVDNALDPGKTLVGCGGTKDSGGKYTTAIGYQSGKTNTADHNTFIGFQAGLQNTNRHNTFIGYKAGANSGAGFFNIFLGGNAGRQTTGNNNIFIGLSAVDEAVTGSHNIAIGNSIELGDTADSNTINIGNIIKAEEFEDTDKDSNTIKRGVIKVCDSTGNNCIKLSREALTCDDDEFFRGFDDNGEKICGPICPAQSQFYWKEENICHKCPRDSPFIQFPAVELEHCQVLGGLCCECPENSVYVLTGPNKNECIINCPSNLENIRGVCRCPWNKPYYYNEKCNKCALTKIKVNGRCKCPPDKPFFDPSDSQCKSCTGATPHYHSGQCNQCPENKVLSKGHCCPEATPHYHSGQCRKCPEDSVVSNNHCCPEATPHYHSGQCNKCHIDTPYRDVYNCYACSRWASSSVWNSRTKKCECPLDKPYKSGDGCYTCSLWKARAVWNSSTKKCECPTERPYETRLSCNTCHSRWASSSVWNSRTKKCECPADCPVKVSVGGYAECKNCDANGKCCFCGSHSQPINIGKCCPRPRIGFAVPYPTNYRTGPFKICCLPSETPTWVRYWGEINPGGYEEGMEYLLECR